MTTGHDTTVREGLAAFRRSIFTSLRVAMPATVVSYTPATAMADVRPVHRIIVERGGEEVEIDPPVIARCPVVMPVAGPFFVSLPLVEGDEVLLVICDRELDTWLYSGDTATPQAPRAHQLTDAVVIPGLSSFANPIAARSATNLVVGLAAGGALVTMTPAGAINVVGASVDLDAATVNVGTNATAAAVLGEALVAWLNTHVHTSAAAGAPTTPPVAPATGITSATVKVQP